MPVAVREDDLYQIADALWLAVKNGQNDVVKKFVATATNKCAIAAIVTDGDLLVRCASLPCCSRDIPGLSTPADASSSLEHSICSLTRCLLGALSTLPDDVGNSALWNSITCSRSVCQVRAVLEECPKSGLNSRDDLINTPLTWACDHELSNIASVLLSYGADIGLFKMENPRGYYLPRSPACRKLLMDHRTALEQAMKSRLEMELRDNYTVVRAASTLRVLRMEDADVLSVCYAVDGRPLTDKLTRRALVIYEVNIPISAPVTAPVRRRSVEGVAVNSSPLEMLELWTPNDTTPCAVFNCGTVLKTPTCVNILTMRCSVDPAERRKVAFLARVYFVKMVQHQSTPTPNSHQLSA